MRTLWKCAREAILIFLAVGLMNWHAHPAFAEQKSLTDDVRGILLQGAHVGDPSKADQLRACAQNSEYSMQSIENVLVTFLSPELRDVSIKEDRMSYLLRASAISVLGDLRCGNALPYLRKTCEATTDDNMRHQALIAVLRTDTKGFMPFAREIFCDRRRYCSHCRFLLYEQLSPYVGVDAVRPVPLGEDALPAECHTLGPLVLQFMRNAVYADITTAGNTKRLDKILCIADEHYKTSHERENVLKRLEDAWSRIEKGKGSPSARAYPAEELRVLRAIPAGKRTHVEIKKIETRDTVEQARCSRRAPRMIVRPLLKPTTPSIVQAIGLQ